MYSMYIPRIRHVALYEMAKVDIRLDAVCK